MPNYFASLLLPVAIIVYILIRQVTPRRPSRARFYVLPIVALYLAYQNFPRTLPRGQLEDAILSVVVSIPFAIMQAYFTSLYQTPEGWRMKGDWRYLASWVALFIVHIGIAYLFNPTGNPLATTTWIIALEVAVVWGLRSVVLHLRYPQLHEILQQNPTY